MAAALGRITVSRLAIRIRRLQRAALTVGTCVGAAAACGHDSTAPATVNGRLSLIVYSPSDASVLTIGSIRIGLRHTGGAVAVDTVIPFPSTVTQLAVLVDVVLAPGTTSAGEQLMLTLDYRDASGQPVFSGGPVTITVVPIGSNQPAPPVIPFSYVGAGSTAKGVRISPRSASAFVGDAFTFAATAQDAAGAAVPNTPIYWLSLNPTIANIGSPATGKATAVAPGSARIVAHLLTGFTDTVTLSVQPRTPNW